MKRSGEDYRTAEKPPGMQRDEWRITRDESIFSYCRGRREEPRRLVWNLEESWRTLKTVSNAKNTSHDKLSD